MLPGTGIHMPALPNRRAFIGTAMGAVVGGFAIAASRKSPAATYQVSYTAAEWRRRLGAERYRILREAGTERAYTSPLLNEHRKGTYTCAGCALPLFSSAAKFDSGTGWPSFWKPLPNAVAYRRDLAFGMVRTEEHCRRCGGHLGHVFDDGPPPTGKRHCINGLSLIFRPA